MSPTFMFKHFFRFVQALRAQFLQKGNISLSSDSRVVIDNSKPKVIHLLDASSGKPLGEPITHELDVVEVALNQSVCICAVSVKNIVIR